MNDDHQLEAGFRPFAIADRNELVESHYPCVSLPLVQKLIDPQGWSLVSVSGFITPEGNVPALTFAQKTAQWPPRLGIGTVFETIERPPFADDAIEAVRETLGHGIFELEVFYNARSGEAYSLDLNPRGFGQMSLDVACGADLPMLWYRSMHGDNIVGQHHVSEPGRRWVQTVPYYIEAFVRCMRGPERGRLLQSYASDLFKRRVDVAHSWADPLPGILFGLHTLRHPRGILRSYLYDTEVQQSETI